MDDVFTGISAVIICSSLLAWLACRGRQPVILAYFACGIIIGPLGFKVVEHIHMLEGMSRFGVALLLFLAGMVLHPDRLKRFFKVASIITFSSCLITCGLVFSFLSLMGYAPGDSLVAALALMFSSTVLVIKLLPTTTLHQKRMGSICIAILIAEDLIAVIVLMIVGNRGDSGLMNILFLLPVKVFCLVALAIVGEQFVIRRMMRSVDRYSEVLVMLCLGWCVGIALLAEIIGISYEVGAFIAGVSLARGKIALILSEQLKPLRDFFLMLYFFVLGASFEMTTLKDSWLPSILLALAIVTLRPLYLKRLFLILGEEKDFARETGLRLGQASEFGMIIAVAASQSGSISTGMAQLIQLTTILTMIISSYIIVFKCPTPIGFGPGRKKD